MNVILQGDGKPFGVLEVDSRSDDVFVEHDLAFLQGAANILGMAIERERYERSLKAAIERQKVLLQEINHRVKNSLMIVASMLRLQASEHGDPELTAHLEEASLRVHAVARAHQRLYQNDDITRLDLGIYIEEVCKDLDATLPGCDLQVDTEHGLLIATDRAISSALIVAELVTNAAKYAHQDRPGGRIWIRLSHLNDALLLSVRDEGDGLPAGFDPKQGKSLGMRIISAFTEQLGGEINVCGRESGTEFMVTFPVNSDRSNV